MDRKPLSKTGILEFLKNKINEYPMGEKVEILPYGGKSTNKFYLMVEHQLINVKGMKELEIHHLAVFVVC